MSKIMHIALWLAVFLSMLGAGLWLGELVVERAEKAECEQWELQSKAFPNHWFIAAWQHDQCLRYGIELKK